VRPFPVRRRRDTQPDIAPPAFEAEWIESGTFPRGAAAVRAPVGSEETIEVSVADVELVSLAPETREESVTGITLVKLAAAEPPEPMELSVSDVEVVRFLPPALHEAMNPCTAFERTFAEAITASYALAPHDDVMVEAVPFVAPSMPEVEWSPAPAPAARVEPAPPRARRRRRSLIPKATLLMAIVVGSSLAHDAAKAGRFDRLASRASSLVRSVRAAF
jgi:hypothetical protein